jgi:hypothetical protein
MNQYEFILGIVIIVMIASVIKSISKHNAKTPPAAGRDPEAERLRDEVKVLKERLAVLERIATDKSVMLDREIEELRDR